MTKLFYYDKKLKELHIPRSRGGMLQVSVSLYGKLYFCIDLPFLAELVFSVESKLYDRKVSEGFINRAFD